MNITISILDSGSNEYQIIEKMVLNTVGSTHYIRNLKIMNCFKLDKPHEDPKEEEKFNLLPNHKLLFHGSRTASFGGILSTNLRVPSSSQVINGSALGTGIYFADCISKSFNYCLVPGDASGFVVICDVALGEVQNLVQADFSDLCEGNSKKANGKYYPNPEERTNIDFGTHKIEVDAGKLIKQKDGVRGFDYNEYVIFDASRCRFRYLLELQN